MRQSLFVTRKFEILLAALRSSDDPNTGVDLNGNSVEVRWVGPASNVDSIPEPTGSGHSANDVHVEVWYAGNGVTAGDNDLGHKLLPGTIVFVHRSRIAIGEQPAVDERIAYVCEPHQIVICFDPAQRVVGEAFKAVGDILGWHYVAQFNGCFLPGRNTPLDQQVAAFVNHCISKGWQFSKGTEVCLYVPSTHTGGTRDSAFYALFACALWEATGKPPRIMYDGPQGFAVFDAVLPKGDVSLSWGFDHSIEKIYNMAEACPAWVDHLEIERETVTPGFLTNDQPRGLVETIGRYVYSNDIFGNKVAFVLPDNRALAAAVMLAFVAMYRRPPIFLTHDRRQMPASWSEE